MVTRSCAGYGRSNQWRLLRGFSASDLLPHLAAARQTYSRIADTHPLTFAAFRQAPWHHYGLLALEQTQLTMRSPYLDNDVVRTLFRAPEAVARNNDLRIRLIGDGNLALRRIRTDMGFAGRGEQFPGAMIRSYHNFTFKAEYAYNHGMPQWMARIDHLLAPLHLERLFLGWHKYYHFRVWYGMLLPNTFAKYCSIRAPSPALTGKRIPSKQWYSTIQRRSELHQRDPQGALAGAAAPPFYRPSM